MCAMDIWLKLLTVFDLEIIGAIPCAENMALQDISSDRAPMRILAMGSKVSKVRDLRAHFSQMHLEPAGDWPHWQGWSLQHVWCLTY